MFILQDNKLYIEDKDNNIIGVNVYHNKIEPIKSEKVKLNKNHTVMTAYEMKCRFNINEERSYLFPKEEVKKTKKEVKKDDSTSKTKKKTGKSK